MLIRGKTKWFKALGKPHPGYEGKFNEWSFDVYVDEATEARLKAEGLGPKLKDKGNGTYITFKRKELKLDGSPNSPIRVVDHRGEAWDQNKKVGNGSVVNANFAINEFGKNQKAANILSVQIWDHVPFENEFPVREDGEAPGQDDDWAKEVA